MKHVLTAALSVLVLVSCATSKDTTAAKVPAPGLEIVQLMGPSELGYPSGAIEVQYGVRITNHSAEPLTLRRIQLEPVGLGGSYTLRRETYYFQQVVAPAQFNDFTFWARAYADGDAFATDAQAPITVRGIAYFDSPKGAVRKVFTKNFNQMGRGR